MKDHRLLDRVSIVLVRTKTPANIGAVARCMMNMGLSNLLLVRPPLAWKDEAQKLAAGAERVLEGAREYPALREAVADHEIVIGTSRHQGRLRRNIATPREMARHVMPLLEANRVAVVFGREVNGLDRRDLALCQEIVSIPASGSFPSLNLSHAVLVVAYELFVASLAGPSGETAPLSSAEDREQFFVHLQQTLEEIGFLDRAHPDRIMLSLRQMFGRAGLDPRDVRMLRGILSTIGRKIATKDR
jgi:tRNA/rRNA methyltransferase